MKKSPWLFVTWNVESRTLFTLHSLWSAHASRLLLCILPNVFYLACMLNIKLQIWPQRSFHHSSDAEVRGARSTMENYNMQKPVYEYPKQGLLKIKRPNLSFDNWETMDRNSKNSNKTSITSRTSNSSTTPKKTWKLKVALEALNLGIQYHPSALWCDVMWCSSKLIYQSTGVILLIIILTQALLALRDATIMTEPLRISQIPYQP